MWSESDGILATKDRCFLLVCYLFWSPRGRERMGGRRERVGVREREGVRERVGVRWRSREERRHG